MFRKPKIRYSSKDKNALRVKQQKVNARIYYERSKGGNTSHLPDTFKIKDIEDSIYSRADYNFMMSQLDKMLEKDAFKTVKTTSGEEVAKGTIAQISNAQRRENIKRAYRRKEAKRRDEESGRLLGSDTSSSFEKRNFDVLDTKNRYYDKTVDRIMKMSTDKYDFENAQMQKENYIKAIYNLYASQDEDGNVLADDEIKELVKHIEQIDALDFVDKQTQDERLSLQWTYQEAYNVNMEVSVLLDNWKK